MACHRSVLGMLHSTTVLNAYSCCTSLDLLCDKGMSLRSVYLQGKRMISEDDLRVYLDKFDKKYWATYKVLDILQKVFYRSAMCISPCVPLRISHRLTVVT